MESAGTRFRIIPGEIARQIEAWETPDFDQPEIERRLAVEEEAERRHAEEQRQRRRARRRQAVYERLLHEDEARRLLPTAEEIEQIRAAARRQGFQEGRREGQREGYHAGYPEGLRVGQEEGWQIGAVLVQRLQTLLDTLGRPLEQLDRDVEDELLHLVFAVSRRLVLKELQAEPAHAVEAVRQALTELPANHRSVTVHVHREEFDFIEEQLGTDRESHGWSLAVDPHLSHGGCLITTETSRVDATIERRLDAVAEQLLGDAHVAAESEQTTHSYRGGAEQGTASVDTSVGAESQAERVEPAQGGGAGSVSGGQQSGGGATTAGKPADRATQTART